jgi:hypothetical protein
VISRVRLIFLLLVLISSCSKDKITSDLERFVNDNSELSTDYLIACAGGNTTEFMGDSENPISIFYYNVDGASEAQLFELRAEGLDPNDFGNYESSSLNGVSLFNGRMGHFKSPAINSEKWFIVCYTTASKLHISDPIVILASTLPTVEISSHIAVTENGIMPSFDWSNDPTDGNVIYFSLISDSANNFISGTYTEVKNWQFYDLSEVVLNVTPVQNPSLNPNENYSYLNMGVDEDNWVRSMGTQNFSTN